MGPRLREFHCLVASRLAIQVTRRASSLSSNTAARGNLRSMGGNRFDKISVFNLEFLKICKFISSTNIFCRSNTFRCTHASRNQSKCICREAEKLCHRLGRKFRFSKICSKVDAGDRFWPLKCSWVLAGANFIALWHRAGLFK